MLYSVLPHGEGGNGIWSWSWEPSVLIGLALISAAYLYLAGPFRRRTNYGPPVPLSRMAAFLSGNLMVFIALVSPLDYLADSISFAAHMVQHLFLLGFAPVLWLVGLPDGLMNAVFKPRFLRQLLGDITRPVPAFAIFNGVLLLWHIPGLYNRALEIEALHITMHLTFMAAAVIGWWPVFGNFPEAAPRARLVIQLFYLFLMMFPSTALAAWITLSTSILYPFYGDASRLLGLTAASDQQLSGLIMWIPGNALFFIVFSSTFLRWFTENSSRADLDNLPGESMKVIEE